MKNVDTRWPDILRTPIQRERMRNNYTNTERVKKSVIRVLFLLGVYPLVLKEKFIRVLLLTVGFRVIQLGSL